MSLWSQTPMAIGPDLVPSLSRLTHARSGEGFRSTPQSGPPIEKLAQRPAIRRVLEEAQLSELSYVVLFILRAICGRREPSSPD